MMIRIILCILFIVSINSFADELKNQKSRIETIDKEIDNNKKKVVDTKKEVRKIVSKIKKLEKDYKKIKKEYNEAENKYLGLNRKIDYGEKNIKLIKSQLDIESSKVEKNLILWYKFGEKSSAEYFIEGDSLLEIATMEENYKRVLMNEKYLIEKMSKVMQNVETEKKGIQSERLEADKIRKEIAEKKSKMNKIVKEKNRLVAKLKKREKSYKREISKLNREKDRIEKRILGIIKNRAKVEKKYNISTIKKSVGALSYPIKGKIRTAFKEKKRTSLGALVEVLGLEINGKIGSRVKSSAKGEVLFADNFESVGKMVIIDHGYGLVTIYQNLIKSYVKVGDKVDKNQKIGILGISKESGEAVLYFETRVNTKSLDPDIFME